MVKIVGLTFIVIMRINTFMIGKSKLIKSALKSSHTKVFHAKEINICTLF